MRIVQAITDFGIGRSDLSPRTVEDYAMYLRRFADWVGDKPLEDVTDRDLSAFVLYMRDKYVSRRGRPLSQAALYNCWCSLRSFYRWCAEMGYCDNVALSLKKPEKPQSVVEPFTKAEIQALLQACFYTALSEPSDGRRPSRYRRPEAERDAAMLLVLLDTGIRVGELTRLNVEDVRLDRLEIEVKPHRSGRKSRPRVIPITRDTQKAMLRWYAARRELDEGEPRTRDGDLQADAPAFVLLRTGTGRRMQRHAIANVLYRLSDRAGVKNVHPHRFRHTFAIEYLRGGGDAFTLQGLLGHTTLEMVRYYLALAQQDYKRVHEQASAVGRWRLYIPR